MKTLLALALFAISITANSANITRWDEISTGDIVELTENLSLKYKRSGVIRIHKGTLFRVIDSGYSVMNALYYVVRPKNCRAPKLKNKMGLYKSSQYNYEFGSFVKEGCNLYFYITSDELKYPSILRHPDYLGDN